MKGKKIQLSHGEGGSMMRELIEDLFLRYFKNAVLDELSDSALLKDLPDSDSHLCFTTDSYTVDPLFFPGGDIGKLSVCGTVNDLAVMGARPLYLSCAVIAEEGLDYAVLEKVTRSLAATARKAKVKVVTGDFKVVEKGSVDRLFINTAGIGLLPRDLKIGRRMIRPGDKVIINGPIAEHGLAVLAVRGGFDFHPRIKSDCAALTGLIAEVLASSRNIRFMRDPTRGGLAGVLNEAVEGMDFGIELREEDIPVQEAVRAACEILGFDPLYIANEGKVVVIAGAEDAGPILIKMRAHPLGKGSRVIGAVSKKAPGKVILKTTIGGTRIIDMIPGAQLPRIC